MTSFKEILGSFSIIGCVLLLVVLYVIDAKGPTAGGIVVFTLTVPIVTIAVFVYFYISYREWKEKRQ